MHAMPRLKNDQTTCERLHIKRGGWREREERITRLGRMNAQRATALLAIPSHVDIKQSVSSRLLRASCGQWSRWGRYGYERTHSAHTAVVRRKVAKLNRVAALPVGLGNVVR